jgi:hypothetical protein
VLAVDVWQLHPEVASVVPVAKTLPSMSAVSDV